MAALTSNLCGSFYLQVTSWQRHEVLPSYRWSSCVCPVSYVYVSQVELIYLHELFENSPLLKKVSALDKPEPLLCI